MKYSEMNRYLYVCKAVLAGLITTQVIGTVHVYLSNIGLYHSMQMVKNAGYFPVPNEHLWGALQGFGAAFWGGLFFALSIGTGLSIGALLCAWTWDRLFKRRKAVVYIYLALWLMGIGAVNVNGFSAEATAYIIIVCPVVFLAAIFWMPSGKGLETRLHRIAFLGAPVLLILFFLPLAKRSVFLDIRDMVLLNNAIGRKINDFYYDYTLYAAQAFKSLEQKTLRTCRLALAENESHRDAIENIFLSRDYIIIAGDTPVDLSVVEQDGRLVFLYGGKAILSTSLREFSANPSLIFQQFSQKTDRFGPLRLLALISMAVGGPLCLYIMVNGLFYLLFILFMKQKRAGYAASLLCLLAGIFIALPLYSLKAQSMNIKNPSAALESELWQERVAALRYIEKNGLADDHFFADTQDRLASPHIAERYWYVRALGSSKSPAARKILLDALDDTSTNVVCMAFKALGRLKEKAAIQEIINRMEKSDKWYEQWYGYRALKSLGWRQTNVR